MTDSILELTVRNHPGVMANITGLFARRAFNLEGILCAPLPETETSRIFISLNREDNVDQIVKQLRKLYDVLDVYFIDESDEEIYGLLKGLWQDVSGARG